MHTVKARVLQWDFGHHFWYSFWREKSFLFLLSEFLVLVVDVVLGWSILLG
jgi:hypothetical protein